MERFTVSRQQAYAPFPVKPQLKYIPQEQPKQVAQLVIEEAEINIFDAERYFSEGQDQKETKKEDKCDVSNVPRFSSVSSVDGYGRNYRTGSFNATPTASSEASWNSQSGLLSNPPGSIAVSMRNLRMDGRRKKAASSKWLFRRRCPCSGKKSVQVEEKFAEPKIVIRSHISKTGEDPVVDNASNEQAKDFEKKSVRVEDERMKAEKLVTTIDCIKGEEVHRDDPEEDCYSAEKRYSAEISHRVAPSGRPFGDGGGFSFPILNPPPPTNVGTLLPSIGTRVNIINTVDDPPRESLEVFQPLDESIVPGKFIERGGGLMSLREEINQRSFNFLTSPNIRKTAHEADDDGDIMSDASSDLFEIESFSTQSAIHPMYRRRDSLDDMSSYGGSRFGRRSLDETTTMATPSIAPTECYEPSEASIDWSVTTAEGFSVANFSVSASEYQDIPTDHSRKLIAAQGSKRRGNGGLLMSCRCEKAVNVAPPALKSASEQQHHHHHRSCAGPQPFSVESNRIQVGSRLSSINIPITRSHSARMSKALTTH